MARFDLSDQIQCRRGRDYAFNKVGQLYLSKQISFRQAALPLGERWGRSRSTHRNELRRLPDCPRS